MNTVTLIGRVGKEVVVRKTANGQPVAGINLAVDMSYTGANGQKVERVTWVDVTCWRTLAETVGKYVVKGQRVAVQGTLETPSAYIDRDGKAQAMAKVTATNVQFLDRPNGNQTGKFEHDAEAHTGPADVFDGADIPA